MAGDFRTSVTNAAGVITGALPAGAAELPWYAVIAIALTTTLLAHITAGIGVGARDGLAVGVRAVVLRRLNVEDPELLSLGPADESSASAIAKPTEVKTTNA